MLTLVEFVAPLATASNRDKILAVLYYQLRYGDNESSTVDDIRDGLRAARIPRWSRINVADVLAKCGPEVDSPGVDGRKRLWRLTKTGERHVRSLLSLPESEPEIEHDVSALKKLVAKIRNKEVADYLNEALLCLSVNALRAAIGFVWTGSIRTIQEQLLAKGAKKLNIALRKHDPKCRSVSAIDHFAYVKDRTTLLAAQELGLFDKNERETLGEALALRNRCGHPGKYKPGPKKASSFIEDVVSIVF